eukprot:101458-Chlamydomonas_euryale.AAC.1
MPARVGAVAGTSSHSTASSAAAPPPEDVDPTPGSTGAAPERSATELLSSASSGLTCASRKFGQEMAKDRGGGGCYARCVD